MEKETKTKITLIIIIIILSLSLCSLILYMFIPKNKDSQQILYSEKAIKIMKDFNVYEEIIKNEYSKTIEELLYSTKIEDNNIEEIFKEIIFY